MKNDFNYKWSKLFASKRYNTKDGVIQLTPEEQQELLDDAEKVVKNCSIPDVINAKRTVCHSCKEDIADCFVPQIKDLRCPECGNQWHTDL